eukprot:6579428-Prymnesium_polylepis.1
MQIHALSCLLHSGSGTMPKVMMQESGLRRRSLGSSAIVVSELGLGTQRWGGTDFNSPDEATCHRMLDMATDFGVNLVDTAEQYPIPSGRGCEEGSTERIIGSWLAKDKSRRSDLVIASKITGGGNVTPKNIEQDLRGTLKRLGTDYLDVYLLHWPAVRARRPTSPGHTWQTMTAVNHDRRLVRVLPAALHAASQLGAVSGVQLAQWPVLARRRLVRGDCGDDGQARRRGNDPGVGNVQRQLLWADGIDDGGARARRRAAVRDAERLLDAQPARRGEWPVGGVGAVERGRR